MKPYPYNHQGELNALVAPLRHPANPQRRRATEQRILCADGHWRNVASCRTLDRTIMRQLDLANMRNAPVEA